MNITDQKISQQIRFSSEKLIDHPSQVIATIRHYLGLPFFTLMSLQGTARKKLFEKLKEITVQPTWHILAVVPVVQEQSAFVLSKIFARKSKGVGKKQGCVRYCSRRCFRTKIG